MCKKLAVISGKGGSGKTSVSLALAQMLSKLGLISLLIDCDMSTHGATFFMKPSIEKHRNSNNDLVSVDEILISKDMPPYGFFSKPLQLHPSENINFERLLKVNDNFFSYPRIFPFLVGNLKKATICLVYLTNV